MTTLRDLGLDQLIKIDELSARSTCCCTNHAFLGYLVSFREMSTKIKELTVFGWIINISSYSLAFEVSHQIRIVQYYFLVWIAFDHAVIF